MEWKDSGGGDFEQASVGTHVARCIRLIDLGTQKSEYQGRVGFKKQVFICWELPTELMTTGEYAGKPFIVSNFYTASLSEKSRLRADLKNWRGRDFTPAELAGFNAKNILGQCCLLSIIEKENGKRAIGGIMALPKGTSVPPQINPTVYFSMQNGEFDPNVYEALSDGIKGIIQRSPEFAEATKSQPSIPSVPDSFDEFKDIPFANPYRGRYAYTI